MTPIAEMLARWADGKSPRTPRECATAAALRAASILYGSAMALRAIAYDSGFSPTYRVACPVISVGNLSTGGTGKTPFVIEIARLLRNAGHNVAIVSRGYRRQAAGDAPRIVSDGQKIRLSPAEAGDEPWMMANELPGVRVIVAADRVAAARHAVDTCQANVIVLDDGFQHRRLARDCDIVLWDAMRPSEAAALLPRGLLREGLGALRRAQAVVFTRCNLSTHSLKPIKRRIKRIAPHLILFEAGLTPHALESPGGKPDTDLSVLQGRPVGAFCGVGNPESFWRLIERTGARITFRKALPDHHRASTTELDAIVREARQAGAERLLITRKDMVNLPAEWHAPLPLAALTARPDLGDDTDRFTQFILQQVAKHNAPL